MLDGRLTNGSGALSLPTKIREFAVDACCHLHMFDLFCDRHLFAVCDTRTGAFEMLDIKCLVKMGAIDYCPISRMKTIATSLVAYIDGNGRDSSMCAWNLKCAAWTVWW
jgi:hypothetical protein